MSTKKQITERIKEVGNWVTAGFFGVGFALVATVIFFKIGIGLIVAGAVVWSLSRGCSLIIPNLYQYTYIKCTACRQENQVRKTVMEHRCENCGRKLSKVTTLRRGKTHLMVINGSHNKNAS